MWSIYSRNHNNNNKAESFRNNKLEMMITNPKSKIQRCIMYIFSDMVVATIKVFMDDFSVFKDSFKESLPYWVV